MTTRRFSSARSDAIKCGLTELVERAPTGRRRRGLSVIVAFTAGALVAGGAVSAAAASGVFWPPVDGPPLPGAPVITVLSGGFTVSGRGETEIALPAAPGAATHLQVVFTCLSAGSFTWGIDPTDNPGLSCSSADVVAGAGEASYSFAFSSRAPTFYVGAKDASEWRLAARFVGEAATELEVNDRGLTFGVKGPSGSPDLIAVVGLDDEGQPVDGYVHRTELQDPLPSSPDEALRWQEEREAEYPDGRPVAVYESDGVTRIGTFVIG